MQGTADDGAVVVSVIIPAHNAEDTIGDQLESLVSQKTSCPWEIVVVDNGSNDATADVVRVWEELKDPTVRLARANRRLSAAYARNAGVTAARGSILLFCDADDVAASGWVETMSRATSLRPLVAGRLDYEYLNPRIEDRYRVNVQTSGPVEFLGIPTIVSASFGCQRWLWDELSGNDETLRGRGGEDLDFGLRAQLELGVSVAFEPNAVMHYRLRDSSRAAFRQGFSYGRSVWQLNHRHRDRAGRRLRVWRIAVKRLARSIADMPAAANGKGRISVAFRFGQAIGTFVGAIERIR